MTAQTGTETPVGAAVDHAESYQTARAMGEFSATLAGVKQNGDETLREIRDLRTAHQGFATELVGVKGMAEDAIRRVSTVERQLDSGKLTWQKVLGYAVAITAVLGTITAVLVAGFNALIGAIQQYG